MLRLKNIEYYPIIWYNTIKQLGRKPSAKEDSMNIIKKSINVSADLAQQIDEFIKMNPGANFTLIANQALQDWLRKGEHTIQIHRPKDFNMDDVDRMIREEPNLMKDLAR